MGFKIAGIQPQAGGIHEKIKENFLFLGHWFSRSGQQESAAAQTGQTRLRHRTGKTGGNYSVKGIAAAV